MSEKLVFDPAIAMGLASSAAIALFLPVPLALVVRRKTGAPWRWLGLGVATFVLSQLVCRLPWQIPLGLWLQPKLKANAVLASRR